MSFGENKARFALQEDPIETSRDSFRGVIGSNAPLRQLHPDNLSSLSQQVAGEISGHASLPAFHSWTEGEPSAPEIIKRLQVQKVDDRAPLPGGRSIPVLPLNPINWQRGVHL